MAHEVCQRGAGELLFTSMDHDGTRDGYPCETFARLAELPIPLIASGGAGSVRHIADVLTLAVPTRRSRQASSTTTESRSPCSNGNCTG